MTHLHDGGEVLVFAFAAGGGHRETCSPRLAALLSNRAVDEILDILKTALGSVANGAAPTSGSFPSEGNA